MDPLLNILFTTSSYINPDAQLKLNIIRQLMELREILFLPPYQGYFDTELVTYLTFWHCTSRNWKILKASLTFPTLVLLHFTMKNDWDFWQNKITLHRKMKVVFSSFVNALGLVTWKIASFSGLIDSALLLSLVIASYDP